MGSHNHRRSAVNQTCSAQTLTPLGIHLTSPRIGKARAKTCTSDLTAQLTFEALGGVTHTCGHRMSGRFEFSGHEFLQIATERSNES
jgi:hypothetical protein